MGGENESVDVNSTDLLDANDGDGTETATPEVEPEPNKSQQWDQARQFRDELSSANKRLEDLSRKEGELTAKLENATQQLEAAKKAKDSPVADDLDLDDYDQMKNVVSSLRKELNDNKSFVQESQKTIGELKSELQQVQSKTVEEEGLRVLNAECDALDARFGAKYRNKVLQDVNKEYEESGLANNGTPAARVKWIKNTLELAYRKLQEQDPDSSKATKTPKKPSSTPVDTGQGGSVPGDEIPVGSFKEVAAAINQRDRRKGW